jgi:UDP-N-acetylglucosamine 2-epimerase (non-hydrolysing)
MLDQVLEVFSIVPDCDLNLMRSNQAPAAFAARALNAISKHLSAEQPDLVLIQGDTTTVFCAALAAFYQGIPVGHVEAGLRTWNLRSPWPEEANRVLTSRLATLHFAPTEWSRKNLLREGVAKEQIFVTGNTIIDSLFLALKRIGKSPPRIEGLPECLQPKKRTTGQWGGPTTRMVLITGHRRENFGKGFENICFAIADLASRFPDVHFVYPVHLNPNVREPVNRILGFTPRPRPVSVRHSEPSSGKHGNIHLIEPLSYLHFVALMNQAHLILTDSGGIQEEAPSLGRPVLVMRDTTERPEAVQAGTARLVGTKRAKIIHETSLLLSDRKAYSAMARRTNPYGDGTAAAQIVRCSLGFLRATMGDPSGTIPHDA